MIFPSNWIDFIEHETKQEYFKNLISFINNEYKTKVVYPSEQDLFRVLKLINPDQVKVVILGQDPYHEVNQANGIAFSTYDSKTPRSLANIFKELKSDLNVDHFLNNDLTNWVKQGVLLLNTILSVQQHKALSHANKGWEIFTLHLLQYLYDQNHKIVFCAFGKNAFEMYSKIKHMDSIEILKFGHPSPFSYEKYFKGTRPFSKINNILLKEGLKPIDWSK